MAVNIVVELCRSTSFVVRVEVGFASAVVIVIVIEAEVAPLRDMWNGKIQEAC